MNAAHGTASTDALERLVGICSDGVAGYREAASKVHEPGIHAALAKASARREEIASVLTNTLGALGHKTAHDGSIAGSLHRAWLDAVAAVSRGSTRAVLRECMRGEHATIHAFTEALGRDLTPEVHACIEQQRNRLLEASAELAQLEADIARDQEGSS